MKIFKYVACEIKILKLAFKTITTTKTKETDQRFVKVLPRIRFYRIFWRTLLV